jgi:hypothetical protein
MVGQSFSLTAPGGFQTDATVRAAAVTAEGALVLTIEADDLPLVLRHPTPSVSVPVDVGGFWWDTNPVVVPDVCGTCGGHSCTECYGRGTIDSGASEYQAEQVTCPWCMGEACPECGSR